MLALFTPEEAMAIIERLQGALGENELATQFDDVGRRHRTFVKFRAQPLLGLMSFLAARSGIGGMYLGSEGFVVLHSNGASQTDSAALRSRNSPGEVGRAEDEGLSDPRFIRVSPWPLPLRDSLSRNREK